MSTSLRQHAVWLIEGAAAWLLYACFRVLPVKWCSAFGGWFGRFKGTEKTQIISRVQEDFAWLLPSISNSDRAALTKVILANSGRSYFEAMIVDRLLNGGSIDINLPHHVQRQLVAGRPIILVTVHLANLGDLIIATLADLLMRQYGYEIGGSPTRPIQNPWMASLSQRIRNQYLSGINGRGYDPTLKTARDFYRFLLKPRSVVLLHLDEAYDRQVHFPSFGRPLDQRGNLFKAIKLASGTGALIQPVHLKRLSDSPEFKVEWLPSFQVESDGAALSQNMLKRHAHVLNELFEPKVFENLADWAQICYLRAPKN